MKRFVDAALITVGLVAAGLTSLPAQAAQKPSAGALARIAVCPLVSKEEVKKHLPWNPVMDQFPLEEESIGASGSSCSYPTVLVQVLPYTQNMVDALHKQGKLEPISGVGDEAYFRNNKDLFAELYAKVGNRLLTLQSSSSGKVEAVKPGVISLAKVFVAKLR
jgi:hypothetical protein